MNFGKKKYNATPNQTTYLAPLSSGYSSVFSNTGNITALKKAELLLAEALNRTHKKSVGYLHALTQNYVKQHRFKEALTLMKKAESIGEKEVKNRPTALSYDLLAWSHLQNNEPKKALNIITLYVENKTSEPTALYHMASIYKANNYIPNKVKKIKKELLGSLYELGPNMNAKIEKL